MALLAWSVSHLPVCGCHQSARTDPYVGADSEGKTVAFAITDQLADAEQLHRREKLIVPKLVKERTTSYATRGFITVFTIARHLSLF